MLVTCQDHRATKWQIWNLKPGLLDSDFFLMKSRKRKKERICQPIHDLIYTVKCELIVLLRNTNYYLRSIY